MYRIYIFLLPVMIFAAVACSSTSQTTRPPAAAQDSVSRDSNVVPGWFSKEESVVYDSSSVHAYAAAIGSDSASAETKAVSRATALLKQAVSDRLETVRAEAVQELGKDSGLAVPGFLIDYRKANSVVDDIVITQQTSAEAVEGQNSFRGFAEVRADRTELIERIGAQLSSYERTWDTLLNSAAFEKF